VRRLLTVPRQPSLSPFFSTLSPVTSATLNRRCRVPAQVSFPARRRVPERLELILFFQSTHSFRVAARINKGLKFRVSCLQPPLHVLVSLMTEIGQLVRHPPWPRHDRCPPFLFRVIIRVTREEKMWLNTAPSRLITTSESFRPHRASPPALPPSFCSFSPRFDRFFFFFFIGEEVP